MPLPRVSIIVAVDKNWAIGKNNQLPFSVPEDMQHFVRTTKGHAVIMGRKTYDSIGRPLPDRMNIVLTRDAGAVINDDVYYAYSLEQAISLAQGHEEVFVIGGGEIYSQALKYASQIYLTRIGVSLHEPDTYMPNFTENGEWVAVEQVTWNKEYGSIWQESKKDGTLYSISRYLRRRDVPQLGIRDLSSRKGVQ